MKVRTGFVSNSSSSSFVCLYKKDEVDALIHTLTGVERLVFDKVTEEEEIFGTEVYVYESGYSHGWSFWEDVYVEDVDDPSEVWEDVEHKLKNVSQWSHSVDM